MTVYCTCDGTKIIWDDKVKVWHTITNEPYINGKKICQRCNKPQLDLNNVKNCDFCLQGLTNCDFIDNACCGHGDDSAAYISLKDGRRFVLDTFNW